LTAAGQWTSTRTGDLMLSDLRWFVVLKDGDTERRCWVDKHVRVGQFITLKDSDEPERLWEVTWASVEWKTKYTLGNQRGWHVGGL
jgi:hypothetical protein